MPIAHRDESFLSLGPHGFHRVAYTDWGAESCQHIVICVHGMTRNSRDFDALAGALAGSCRVASMASSAAAAVTGSPIRATTPSRSTCTMPRP